MDPDLPRTQTALGYLRGLITLLVVTHHAVLAYHPFAPPPPDSPLLGAASPWWRAFPVVDPARWEHFAGLVAWNDMFFMSLMFFLSGLFVWRSLGRKGSARFVRDRAVRIGIPWLVALIALAPLAYAPTWLQAGGGADPIAFARMWIGLEAWPTGPAWFLWVLLALDLGAAAVHAVARARAGWAPRSALVAFALLVAASAAAYLPVARVISPLAWGNLGPLVVQTARAVHYAVYFAAGVMVGGQLERSFLVRTGLRRWWPAWVAAAAVAFYAAMTWAVAAMMGTGAPGWADVGFVLSCAASSFAALAVGLRFTGGRRIAALESLRANAYGIYLVHYAVVAWLQYALLGAAWSGLAKGVVVTTGAIAISWAIAAALRRVRWIARVIG